MVLWKIRGVRIRINLLLIVMALLYAWLGFLKEMLLVFSGVLLHEMAHFITAASLGIKITEITIWPFGGQALVDDFTALNPQKEVFTALSGPLSSLAVAASIYFFDLFSENYWKSMFFNINLCLGLFNLLPALPLDGGRVLQSVLSERIGYRKAARWTALLGKALGIGMMGSGAYYIKNGYEGVNILAVGVFLVWAAFREERLLGYAFMRFLVRKKKELSEAGFLPARQLVGMPAALLKDVLAAASPANYLVVLLVDADDRIVAMKSEAELIELLLEKGPQSRLRDCL